MAAEVVRMAQVTGACDHIKFQARRREHACEGRHGGCMGVHIEAHKTHQGYPETNRNDVGQESISCMLRQFHLTRIHGGAWLIISPPTRPPLARVPADEPTRSKVSASSRKDDDLCH